MTVLRIAGDDVGCYDWSSDAVPRPMLHPLRTLDGAQVTDAAPADHPWHRGIGIALPDVNGTNLWGGPTYRRGLGYVETGHGHVCRRTPVREHRGGIEDSLAWCDEADTELLHETRSVTVTSDDRRMALEWRSELTAVPDVSLASPGSNGRAGAGYGGFFWRLPRSADLRVFTPEHKDDDANGIAAPWVAVTTREWSAIITALDPRTAADPWFVRVAEYPAIGSALAWDRPLRIESGDSVCLSLRVLFLDEPLDVAAVQQVLGR